MRLRKLWKTEIAFLEMNRTHKGSGQFRVLCFLVRMMHVGLRFRIEIADVR